MVFWYKIAAKFILGYILLLFHIIVVEASGDHFPIHLLQVVNYHLSGASCRVMTHEH